MILIAGGGIGGLALALTLHEIGVPCRVFEARRALQPLGVGINVQPLAARELHEMGLGAAMDAIGVRTRDYRLYTRHGLHVWTEPRGLAAGYRWPQYSVHRGALHMMLLDAFEARTGGTVETGWRAEGFANETGGVALHLRASDGTTRTERGTLLVAADGIHSAIRAQIAPREGPPAWGGSILYRGTTRARPFGSGASMVLAGGEGLRFVCYPISGPGADGLATLNWIVNLAGDPEGGFRREDYARRARPEDYRPALEDMVFPWFDVPRLVRGAAEVFEYPMVDRDPLPRWTHGRVTLLGDAAHAAYPVGSNGAGAAILDARRLGRALLDGGVGPSALEAYEAAMRPVASKVVLLNREAGPDRILDTIDRRCGGSPLDRLEDVVSPLELAAHAEGYKRSAGTDVAAVNDAPRTIPEGARVSRSARPARA